MDRETKLFWASLDFLTLKRVILLRKHFGTLAAARKHFSSVEFQKAGISERGVESLMKKYREFDFENIKKCFEQSGAELIFYEEKTFPEPLKRISTPPMFLFVKGTLLPTDTISLSVVGTRRASRHGKQAISYFLPDVIAAGMTIVSGMARGIDTAAHREALRHGGRTVAIWGTGIDRIYPRENGDLAREIQKNGAVIAEFPLGTEPHSYNFPRRNRLIAAFSLGTLVVEGKAQSGSIITALLALEYGKEVFAVPGSPFYRLSEATNNLVKRGEAKLVQNSVDILNEFPFLQRNILTRKFTPENELEQVIWETLTTEPLEFDELVYRTNKPSSELSATLTTLAIQGVVQDLGMNQWVRNF